MGPTLESRNSAVLVPAGWEVIPPLPLSTGEATDGVLCPGLGFREWIQGRESTNGLQRWWWNWGISHKERLGDLGLLSLGERGLGLGLINVDLQGECEEFSARPFSVLHSDHERWQTWSTRKFFLSIKRVFVTARQTEHWGRLPREASRMFSILGDTQKLFVHSPEQPTVADSALGREIALDNV